MPQVLSNYPGAKILAYGPGILPDKFPNIAKFVMQVITAQASCDAMVDQMHVYLMGAEPRLGFAALDALSSSDARRAAFLGVAKKALSPDNLKLVEVVFKLTGPIRKLRNEFAHSLWGIADRPKDAAIMIPGAAITLALIKDREFSILGPEGRADVAADPAGIDQSLCYAYTEKDAAHAAGRAFNSMSLINDLTMGLYILAEVSNEGLLVRLRNRPAVAQALQKMSPQPNP